MNILFLVAHRLDRSPGQRFRFEQYLSYLQQNGFQCTISYLIDEQDDAVFYARGKYISKFLFLLKSLKQRFLDLKRADFYDIVFLYRDAHPLGITWFEKKLSQKKCKLVLDFDDSIWLQDISNGNKNLSFLKRPEKTPKIITLCDAVIVGNRYLADYAQQYNNSVHIIPTTLETDYYTPEIRRSPKDKICIVWTGSQTTIKHFSLAVPFLNKLKEKYKDKIFFKLISDQGYEGHLEGLEFVKWNRDTEVSDLAAADIGIMPLPDDAWSRGKCGFKGLQYMALGIPAVMSPVGVNKEIVKHGENGFLASTEQEWETLLQQLIDDASLRKKLGDAGRKTVVDSFSYESQKDKYLQIFKNLVS